MTVAGHPGAGYIDIVPITGAVRDHSRLLLSLTLSRAAWLALFLCLGLCHLPDAIEPMLCRQQPPSPPPGPSPTPAACTTALTNLCDEDRRKSAALCGLCAGIHQQQTREAGCTNTMIAKFCTNATLGTNVNLTGA